MISKSPSAKSGVSHLSRKISPDTVFALCTRCAEGIRKLQVMKRRADYEVEIVDKQDYFIVKKCS